MRSPTPTPLYVVVAQTVAAFHNCTPDSEWRVKHEERLEQMARDLLPSGSGFDNGTTIDLHDSTANKLVLHTSYHHIDENGFYCGWSEHTVIVTPSFLGGFDLAVKGRNVRDVKEYIGDTIHECLTCPIVWDNDTQRYFDPQLRRAVQYTEPSAT